MIRLSRRLRCTCWLHVAVLAAAGGDCRHEAAAQQFHTRAIWIDPASFATQAAADATLARCRRAGLNILLPDVLINQTAFFRTTHFLGKVAANEHFDPLAYFVRGAHSLGMKVEAWCCVYYEGASARASLRPEWLVASMTGQPLEQRFLSPAIPEVNDYLLSVVGDLLAYDIDGVHLDYIRFPGTSFDYSAAGRAAFRRDAGFDAKDFLDHADRLAAAGDDPYPIRVLQPVAHAAKPWETTAIERTLDQAGLGFGFVSEAPERLARLATPGLLILSSYGNPSEAMIAAIADFVGRGGDLLWTEPPARGLARSPRLRELAGLRGARWEGKVRTAFRRVKLHPLAAVVPEEPFTTSSACSLEPTSAETAAVDGDGSPAITVRHSMGRAVVVGPHLMKSTSPAAVDAVRAIASWLRTQAGVDAADPLAERRKIWVEWRAERVTHLVRAIHGAARARTPPIAVSSSGGPSPVEKFSCFRDAGRWLTEGLNDHVFPMNYTEDPQELDDMLRVQSAAAPPGTKDLIFPGLQTYARRVENGSAVVTSLDAAAIERQLELVRAHGYRGFAIFAYNTVSDDALAAIRRAGEHSRAP